MLTASLMGATAFQKGLGAVHALAHPIGGLYNAHHGLLNAILLPYVLRHNRTAIESKMTHLGRYLNLPHHSFDGVHTWLMQLIAELQLPKCLSAIDIDTSQADLIAQRAFNDPSSATNPIALSIQDYKNIFIAAVQGD